MLRFVPVLLLMMYFIDLQRRYKFVVFDFFFYFFSLAKNHIGLHRWWHPSKAGISCALAVEEAVGVQHVSARQPVPHFRAFLGLLLLMLLSAV